jgi:hypothetical protein
MAKMELYPQLQHLPQIMADGAWDLHHGEDGSSTIVVAIVDTGVDYLHPDLTDNVWQNLGEDADGDGHTLEEDFFTWRLDPGDINGIDDDGNGYTDDLIGWDFYNASGEQDNDPADVRGHGTHCSGIAAGVTNNSVGIASISWNVNFMITKHWNDGEFGELTYDGIIYAAENGADIISNSWASALYSQANQLVVEYATGLGSIVVAAAANDNNNIEIMYPASYPHVISVAAVASTDQKTSYSNYGMAIDVSAPGGDDPIDGGIISTVMGGGYEGWDGTSMATPMVAGLLALVKSYHPDWDNEQIVTQVLGTADDIDAMNHGYENMLGSGRINADRALAESGVTVAEELRVEWFNVRTTDTNGNDIFEPGEVVDLDFTLRNYTHFVGDDDAQLTLTCDDPDIVILAGSFMTPIPADDYLDIDGVFQIQIDGDATSHFASLTLNLESDVSVIFGSEMEFELAVAPSGILVCEGVQDGQDYSGSYIRDVLTDLGLDITYSTTISTNLSPFDAVFLSFGNWGQYLDYGTYFSNEETAAMIDYLENGGKMYVEGGSFIGAYDYFGHPDLSIIMQLYGVGAFSDNLYSNPLDGLVGQPSTLAEGMEFTESTQVHNWYINTFVPTPSSLAAFEESGHGIVALQNEGSYGQKTFLFSYSLSDLVDGDYPSTRYNLLFEIAEFFELAPIISAIGEEDREEDGVPDRCVLQDIYPNPFNPCTKIRFGLPEMGEVTMQVFDVRGRLVKTLVHEELPLGWHTTTWNGQDTRGRDVSSGTYLVRMITEGGVKSQKIMLVR